MFKSNPKLIRVFLLGFILALHLALISYINSSFLARYIGENNVGFLYAIGSVATVIALLFIPKILKSLGVRQFLLYAAMGNALTLLCLALPLHPYILILAFIFYFILNNVIIFLLDESVQIFSRGSPMGRIRGFYLTLTNAAWVITVFLYSRLLGSAQFSTLYFISFVSMTVFAAIILLFLQHIPDPSYDSSVGLASIRKFIKRKSLVRAYLINFLLQFFYAWMIIYTPIYLYVNLGFSWTQIGTIFAIMLVPFVLIQAPLGAYSDRAHERGMLMFGFLIMMLATFMLYITKIHSVMVWAALLFTTRVGAAIVEVMSDVYFFKHINSSEDECIGIYRNTAPMAYVIAPIIAFLVFYFTSSFNDIFIVLSVIMLLGVYLTSTIKRQEA